MEARRPACVQKKDSAVHGAFSDRCTLTHFDEFRQETLLGQSVIM